MTSENREGLQDNPQEGAMTTRRSMLCVLPDTAIRVEVRHPHPCGGYYTESVWCYGQHGRIGYWLEDR